MTDQTNQTEVEALIAYWPCHARYRSPVIGETVRLTNCKYNSKIIRGNYVAIDSQSHVSSFTYKPGYYQIEYILDVVHTHPIYNFGRWNPQEYCRVVVTRRYKRKRRSKA